MYDASNQETVREMRDIAPFVFSCQTVDGGFADIPEQAEDELAKSDAETTLQGLHILYSLTKVGVLDNSFLSELSGVEAAASAYVRGCLKGRKGVRANLHSKTIDLRANFRFMELIEEFDQFDYGSIAELDTLLTGIGILCGLLGIWYFYKEQLVAEKTLPENFVKDMSRELIVIFALSTAGLLSIYFIPCFSILVYLALFIYIGMRLFDYIANDQTQGEFFDTCCSHYFFPFRSSRFVELHNKRKLLHHFLLLLLVHCLVCCSYLLLWFPFYCTVWK